MTDLSSSRIAFVGSGVMGKEVYVSDEMDVDRAAAVNGTGPQSPLAEPSITRTRW